MTTKPLLAAVSLIASSLSIHAQEVRPENMSLFLLIGQSNMAGRGKIEADDLETSPRIFMLAKNKEWVQAKDPVHFDKPDVVGVGPAMPFSRALLKVEPTAVIGLIPAAHGGSSMRDWKPRDNSFFSWAVSRTKLASSQGTLRGILWHQGESDTADKEIAAYVERFSAMIAQLRTELHAENVPVVVGEIGKFRPNADKFNAELAKAAALVPHCAVVSSEGLTDIGDATHFDSRSQHLLGERYAEAFLKLEAVLKK